MKKKCLIITSVIGVLLLILGAVIDPIVQIFVRSKVIEAVMIKEGAQLYDIWKEMPIPIYMQFYMFNLTNPEEVRAGQKPAMEQRGPYTYREYRHKKILKWNPNGTVTYRQTRTFFFMPNMSVGDESDKFISVNIPFMTLASSLWWEKPGIQKIISFTMGLFGEDIFMKRSMKDIIWGYVDPALTVANMLLPEWFYTDFVGYFINKNDTDDGLYTIFTGEKDITKLGVIDKYNSSSYVNFWTTKYANMVNGSDGTVAPPFLEKMTSLPMFSSDICRSISGDYTADSETPQGIALRRFTGGSAELANVSINPDNLGFCTPQSKCMGSGVLNISTCQLVDYFHIPVVVSFPHFYMAADEYLHGVYGMHPNKEEHETFVDVHPMTGLVLQVAKRLQVNMFIQKIPHMKGTHNVSPVVMPIFWLNESAVVDDSHADMLKSMLLTPLLVVQVIRIVIFSLGGAVVLTSILLAFFQHCRHRIQEEEAVLRADSQNAEEKKPMLSKDSKDGDISSSTYQSIAAISSDSDQPS